MENKKRNPGNVRVIKETVAKIDAVIKKTDPKFWVMIQQLLALLPVVIDGRYGKTGGWDSFVRGFINMGFSQLKIADQTELSLLTDLAKICVYLPSVGSEEASEIAAYLRDLRNSLLIRRSGLISHLLTNTDLEATGAYQEADIHRQRWELLLKKPCFITTPMIEVFKDVPAKAIAEKAVRYSQRRRYEVENPETTSAVSLFFTKGEDCRSFSATIMSGKINNAIIMSSDLE
jgi:hypothetical protein